MCGEHSLDFLTVALDLGSSPRVWGTLTTSCGTKTAERFIPTCVGNITQFEASEKIMPVHPHVCGEHEEAGHGLWPLRGSSPRVWGTCKASNQHTVVIRFIPTCVGNMIFRRLLPSIASVHPHVCGEHALILLIVRLTIGSSPRVWGTYLLSVSRCYKARFIPTCVGNINVE